MLNIIKVVAQIAAGVTVWNAASDVIDKLVIGLIKKVIEAKSGANKLSCFYNRFYKKKFCNYNIYFSFFERSD